MFRFIGFIFLSAALAVPVAAQQSGLGIFSSWGAFRDAQRCYAISEPENRDGKGGFAAVSWWPRSGVRGQVHFRLPRPKRPGSAVLLKVDERTFQLIGGGADAWAADARGDADIVASMRTGLAMTVETRDVNGALIRAAYPLRGAASAIDAAAVGCTTR